jgi:sorbitol-specific phosphotransferase system component IIBC
VESNCILTMQNTHMPFMRVIENTMMNNVSIHMAGGDVICDELLSVILVSWGLVLIKAICRQFAH